MGASPPGPFSGIGSLLLERELLGQVHGYNGLGVHKAKEGLYPLACVHLEQCYYSLVSAQPLAHSQAQASYLSPFIVLWENIEWIMRFLQGYA